METSLQGVDDFAIAFTREELKKRLEELANPAISNAQLQQKYPCLKDRKSWKLAGVRNTFLSNRIHNGCDRINEDKIRKILYRPFDWRWIYHDRILNDRPRHRILNSLYSKNKALVLGRSGRATPSAWDLAIVSENIVDLNIFYRGGGTVFPLILGNKKINFSKKAFESFKTIDESISAEDVFWYVYGVLNSSEYREAFSEELEHDFPRIPFPKSFDLFNQMANLGRKLGEYTFLQKEPSCKVASAFPVAGNHLVKEPRYDETKMQIYINEDEFFAGVPVNIWKYTIGGYPVLFKWLKDRKGRKLSLAEIERFERIINVLSGIMVLIDETNNVFEQILASEILNIQIEKKNGKLLA